MEFNPGQIMAAGQIESNGICARRDSRVIRLVDDAPDLAETPPKFSSRIARHLPQQFAKLTSANGIGR